MTEGGYPNVWLKNLRAHCQGYLCETELSLGLRSKLYGGLCNIAERAQLTDDVWRGVDLLVTSE